MRRAMPGETLGESGAISIGSEDLESTVEDAVDRTILVQPDRVHEGERAVALMLLAGSSSDPTRMVTMTEAWQSQIEWMKKLSEK